MFARVAVNIPSLSSLFDYALPLEFARARVGCLVAAPFGKQTVQGVILELTDSSPVENPKPILSLLDPQPVLTQPQIELAKRLAESTLNPLAAILQLMIPSGLNQQADVLYAIAGGKGRENNQLESNQDSVVGKRLVELLSARGPLRGRQIDSHFAKVNWRKTAQALVRRGVLVSAPVLPPPRARAKYLRVAQLAVSPQEAEAEMDSLGTKQTLARRQAALRFLIQQPEAVNLSWIYASCGCNLSDLQALEERGLIRLFENEIFRDPLAETQAQESPRELTLTPEQSSALTQILNVQPPANPYLLYGVTGSGKTEIYLRAAEETVKRGRQVLVLVPEIALTPQTVNRFLARFPGQVGLIHSKLSEGERYDTWRRARSGKLKVVIGARSALFAPLANIGLIVVDECHDSSYYQSEPPFYHAVKAAQEYARLCGAICVLGSATPTAEQRYAAETGRMQQLKLPKRATESELPPVQTIDMRAELKSGGRGIFSRALSESLAEVLARGEQAILFLNRRGAATYVFCRECGYVLKCPRCETPLTLHLEAAKNLLCHRCGYARQEPKTCPACGGKQIRAYGLGAEKVEAEVRALFPQARVLRWDRDATRAKDSHEMILTHFAHHQADVLVGTQMLAKGLDLPLVTLVGIVLADVGLTLPDPFAAERVFQILTQVAGRAGRSARGGKVILQTFLPEHYAIQFAAKHDADGFYRRELEYRRALGYPPFMRLARLEYRHAEAEKAETEAKRAAQALRGKIQTERRVQTELLGPVPSFFDKMDGIHRRQIILRAPDPVELLRDFKAADWRVEIDPPSLL